MAIPILCIGGAVLDRKYRGKQPLVMRTSNPVEGFRSFGGVARNVTENLARLGCNVSFCSMVGEDEGGRALIAHLADAGARTARVSYSAACPTAEYVAILDPSNELVLGIADMQAFELLTPEVIAPAVKVLPEGGWLFFDCNLPAETIAFLFEQSTGGRFRMACDTVSTPKASRLPARLNGLDIIFTNADEAAALLRNKAGSATRAAHMLTDAGARAAIVTDGSEGLALHDGERLEQVHAVSARPIDITGAGDALIAGVLYALTNSQTLMEAARTGSLLAALTIESKQSVRSDLTPDFLSQARHRMPAQNPETT